MSSRAVRLLTAAFASMALGVFAPVAMAIPDLDDVKDKVDEVKDEAEDKADEAKEEAEEAVEENAPDVPAVPVPPSPSAPVPSTDGPRDSSGERSGDRGSSRGESGSRRRGGSSRGRRSPSPASSAPAAAPGALVAPTPGQPFDPLAAEAARAKPEDLLGPGAAGPVLNVPRGVLVKRPAAAQTDRLRRRLAAAGGCLGDGLQARALGLRAQGRSWAGVGSRLGMSSRRALGLGRLGLARLSTLAGGCGRGGGGPVAGPVAFSQRFGAEGIGAVAMLGMGAGAGGAGAEAASASGSGAGAGAPSVAASSGGSGGGVLGDTARGGAMAEDGQSNYVGPPPAPPGSTLALDPGTSASSGDGNGQGAEIAQALGLLALALILVLALRYRLRPSPAAGATGGSSRFRRGSRRTPEREAAQVGVPVGAVAHADAEGEHDHWADDRDGYETTAYAGSSAVDYAGHPGAHNGHGAGQNGHGGGASEELAEPHGYYGNGANGGGLPAVAAPAEPVDAEPPHEEPAPAETREPEAVITGESPAATGNERVEAGPATGEAPDPRATPNGEVTPDSSATPDTGFVAHQNGAEPSASTPVGPASEAPPSTPPAPVGEQPAWHERPRARRVKRLFSSRDS